MLYQTFIDKLAQETCPAGLDSCLRALWYDRRGDWHRAHEIVQAEGGQMPARIHAYLHRKEGDDWNARYWHRKAGSAFPEGIGLEEEWDQLVRQLTED